MPPDPNDPASAGAPESEEALIAEFWAPLAADLGGAYDLQDDCATIAPPPGTELVVTADALIAGVHFLPDEEPASIAWKALAVNVSDLVAKGATPLAYLMTLALPGKPARDWLASYAAGLAAAQQAFGCRLAGGDTDRTPGPLSVSITALGTVPIGGMVRRAGARPGDHVYVSGTIGDATLGLAVRLNEQAVLAQLAPEAQRYLAGKFSRPQPPVALGAALRACASAAIDISDGLLKDFDRLCRVSGVSGSLDASRVPLSEAARTAIDSGIRTAADLMTGGEDYEVLATVPPGRAAEFEQRAAACDTRVTRIGEVGDGQAGASVLSVSGEPMRVEKMGWDHFS